MLGTKKPKFGEIHELIIENVAFKGKGIAHIAYGENKLVVFVRDALPGDTVQVRITAVKRRHAEAVIEDIITPSPDRIEPRCKHFNTCGGCTWQNTSYEKQLSFKEQHVRESLERIGDISTEVRPIIPCDTPYYYRNKVELSFGDNSDEPFVLGFHVPGRRYDIFDLEECFLLSEKMAAIAATVRDFFVERGVPFYRRSRNEGVLESLFIRHSKTDDQYMIMLKVRGAADDSFSWADDFAQLFDESVVSVFLMIVTAQKGSKTVTTTRNLYGADHISETLTINGKSHQFSIGPYSFFQPNPRQAEKLYTEIVTALQTCIDAGLSSDAVVDLYCGIGSISLFLAHAASHVYGLELVPEAIEDAKKTAHENGVENCTFTAGDVRHTIDELPVKPEIIVTDPPRAGMDLRVVEKLCEIGPKALIYVSCNPTTLARDLKLFVEAGYTLSYVQPVDMFPQTYHSENIALLRR